MSDDMESLARRIQTFGVRIEVGPVLGRPNTRARDEDNWEHDAYRVRLSRRGEQMTLKFRKGIGHHGNPPQLDEVLDSIAIDSASVENAESFEDWASDFGLDPDSRKALATFNLCVKQAKDARRLLGPENYDLLLWNTERL